MKRLAAHTPRRSSHLRLISALAVLGLVVLTSPAEALRFTQADVARVDALLSLVMQRLAIAPEVAAAKWSAQRTIDDPIREQQLVDDATALARDRGCDARLTAGFFRAQIEASKIVQRRLFAEWTAAGRPTSEPAADLARDVRPKLDRLTPELVQALSETLPVLSRPGGRQLLRARTRIALTGKVGDDAAIQAALAPLGVVCH